MTLAAFLAGARLVVAFVVVLRVAFVVVAFFAVLRVVVFLAPAAFFAVDFAAFAVVFAALAVFAPADIVVLAVELAVDLAVDLAVREDADFLAVVLAVAFWAVLRAVALLAAVFFAGAFGILRSLHVRMWSDHHHMVRRGYASLDPPSTTAPELFEHPSSAFSDDRQARYLRCAPLDRSSRLRYAVQGADGAE